MKCPYVFFTRPATLLMLAGLCLALSSCDKLKELLPQPVPKEPAERPLTEEELKLQKTMEDKDVFSASTDAEAPKAEPFEVNKSAQVSILLYHDFVERIPRTDMMVSIPVFRAQMQALKDANIAVIPMSDVLAWKRGEKNIPEESVVISLDDGWLGVHQYAYPILKEFKYPFTLYLYKKYVGTGGRSMTVSQIKAMLMDGAELGSHSASHKFMVQTKKSMAPDAYQKWLNEEIVESKHWLEETFQAPCRTFAYPFGEKNAEIVKQVMDAGYEGAVTVNPQKCTWDTPNGLMPRFTQIYDQDGNFKLATNFHGGGGNIANSKFIKTDEVDAEGKKMVELKPEPNSTISDRLPLIEANLSKLGGIVPESIVMRVSGFGPVPVEFDPATQTVSYRVLQRIRVENCGATLSFKRVGADKDEVVNWQFKVDRKASYAPQGAVTSGQ